MALGNFLCQETEELTLREKVRGFMSRDRWREGRRILEEEVRRDPGDAEARAHLGFFCVKESRYDTARGLAEYAAALALDPKCFAANLYRAVTLGYLGKPAEAMKDLDAAEDNNAPPDDLLWAEGCVALETGSPEKAQALFRRLVELRPDSSGYIMLAKSYYQAGRIDEALVWLTKSLEADPQDFRPLVYRGIYLAFLRRFDEARGALAQAERMNKDYALLHHSLAYIDREEGKIADAERRLRTALAVDPDYVTSMKMLAEICAESGRVEEAENYYKAALELFPDYREAREGLSRIQPKP